MIRPHIANEQLLYLSTFQSSYLFIYTLRCPL